MYVRVYVRVYIRTCVCTYVCMYVCRYVFMYVCTYVCGVGVCVTYLMPRTSQRSCMCLAAIASFISRLFFSAVSILQRGGIRIHNNEIDTRSITLSMQCILRIDCLKFTASFPQIVLLKSLDYFFKKKTNQNYVILKALCSLQWAGNMDQF